MPSLFAEDAVRALLAKPDGGWTKGPDLPDEKDMIQIADMWLAGHLPIKDGLYRVDGLARTAVVDPSASGAIRLLDYFDLVAALGHDPGYVTSVDVTSEFEIPDGMGYLFCGEGSHGSEGLFGRLDRDRNLVWVMYLEHANPFVEVRLVGSHATFRSSSGVSITVDLASPEFGYATSAE